MGSRWFTQSDPATHPSLQGIVLQNLRNFPHQSSIPNMKSNTSLFSLLAILALVLVVAASWVVNLYKLTQCDFAAPYKGEALHAAGLIPVVSVVTAWVDAK